MFIINIFYCIFSFLFGQYFHMGFLAPVTEEPRQFRGRYFHIALDAGNAGNHMVPCHRRLPDERLGGWPAINPTLGSLKFPM